MNRPAIAAAAVVSAALVAAGCGTGQAGIGSAGSAGPSPDGTQSYATMVDLYGAVSSSTHCSGAAMQPTTLARAQAACDLGGGRHLVLQLWTDSAGRDKGVAELAAAKDPAGYCFVEGTGTEALWSVDASEDAGVCTALARRLGGRVVQAGGDSAGIAGATASSATATDSAGSR